MSTIPTEVCLTCLHGGSVNNFPESSIHNGAKRVGFTSHDYVPVTLTVGPAPSPSADHAELLKEADVDDQMIAMALDMPRNEYAISLIRRLAAALRIARPPAVQGVVGIDAEDALRRAIAVASGSADNDDYCIPLTIAEGQAVLDTLAALRAASPSPVLCAKCGHGGTEMGHAALWCYEDGCTCTGWIASPSPGAVEAAFREGYERCFRRRVDSVFDADDKRDLDDDWNNSAAQRGAAGGQDG